MPCRRLRSSPYVSSCQRICVRNVRLRDLFVAASKAALLTVFWWAIRMRWPYRWAISREECWQWVRGSLQRQDRWEGWVELPGPRSVVLEVWLLLLYVAAGGSWCLARAESLRLKVAEDELDSEQYWLRCC